MDYPSPGDTAITARTLYGPLGKDAAKILPNAHGPVIRLTIIYDGQVQNS